ncbi:hypothetical protein EV644_109183 [Kribbella orskensis]|uniref:Uncharacterized protein n=1 Tax=Kribbella orskensis TaxID=2512216 RepID=A0ABY2BHG2_9ACTN|nr:MULTISPECIES: hypothetical protein [Kribbella]TCN38308.1 hypothetical protein EV642_10993 [Kribbella sp. VKM Ac-2500]TCO20162.1 hypothetical protein EV644_109183 [Kribbella orskensis]
MSALNRRSVLGALGTLAATTATGWTATAAAGLNAAGGAVSEGPTGVLPHPAPRPVAPVNAEIAAAHSAAYRTLPQVVVDVDVEDLMKIHTAEDAEALRPQLVAQVWKDTGVIPATLPEVRRDIGTPAELPALTGVRRYDRLEVAMRFGYVATVFLVEPVHRTHRRIAFYHNGHGEPLDTLQRTTQGLLDHGYTVLLFAMPFYHWNPKTLQDPVDPMVRQQPSHNDLNLWESAEYSPLALFLEPLAVAMNHVQATYRPSSVQMIGLSGGGWATTIYPALDPRITRSYPTAGSLPFFVRPGSPKPSPTRGDWEQRQDKQPGFYGLADFPDLYALAAVGRNRRQLQILNRFDECCFNGVGHRSYEAAVRQRIAVIGTDAVSNESNGHWELLEDATHGDHTISPYALSVILWDLDVHCAQLP